MEIPFGEYSELSKEGVPKTGTYNFGGVTGTAGGLLFATGTLDNKIRAIDINNGEELWNFNYLTLGQVHLQLLSMTVNNMS